jgi:hypothetical protein
LNGVAKPAIGLRSEGAVLQEARKTRVRPGRKGCPSHDLRYWTSLMDAQTAPAFDLVHVYARRWEHE